MSTISKINTSKEEFRYEKVEESLKEFEIFVQKFFNDKRLKIGFSIYKESLEKRVSLEEYLVTNNDDFGEFSVYAVRNPYFNSMIDIVNTDVKDRIFIGKFNLNQLDGCCGICVLFKVMINIDYRGKKFGQYLMNLQQAIALDKDFSVMLCTDVMNNEPQKAILKKFGFISRFNFVNIKTKHSVELQSVNLRNEQWKKQSLIFRKFQPIINSLKKIFSRNTTKSHYSKNILEKK